MRIPRVHVETPLVVGQKVTFDRNRTHYLKHVLRLKPGAAVIVFNGDGKDYRATLSSQDKNLAADIESAKSCETELGLQANVIQAVGKTDRLDWLIQKTTELGVSRIALFNAEHTQHPIKSAQSEKKLAHWRAVAISACEQSGRARVPEILLTENIGDAIGVSDADMKVVLDFGGETLTSQLAGSVSSLAILIGPEGGLSKAELETSRMAGFQPVSLGPRVLRFETAAIAALAIAGKNY